MNEPVSFELTSEDKSRYKEQIEKIDLSIEAELINKIPAKIQSLMQIEELSPMMTSLIQDISKLVIVLRDAPTIPDPVRRKIIFALRYFYDPEDDIPDNVTGLGFLDDAIVVKWVVDQVIVKYPDYFQA